MADILPINGITRRIKDLLQAPSGRWRSDDHILLTILRKKFHQQAMRLVDGGSDAKQAAIVCAAIVKLDLIITALADRMSSERLLDAVRLLGVAAGAAERGSVSTTEGVLTTHESAAINDIITELETEATKRTDKQTDAFPPFLGSLALPLRQADGYRRAHAIGPAGGNLSRSSDAEAVDNFVIAHRR